MLRYLISFLFLFLLINFTSTSQTIISDNFSGSSLPSGWSIQSTSSDEFTWIFLDGYDDIEVYESKTTAQNEWLILPEMDLSACSDLTFNFELCLYGKSSFTIGKTAELKIKVTTDGANWSEEWSSASIPDTEFSGEFNFFKKRAINLAGYCGKGMQNVKIAFQFISTGVGASATAFAALVNVSAIAEFSKTYIPDDNFEQALIDLGYDSGPLDDSVLTANVVSIENLNVSNKNISDLTGIEDFAALSTLEFDSNNVIVVDLSKNLKLSNLSCINNKLMELDLSNNSILTVLRCQSNNLTSLILPSSQSLCQLYCNDNQLSKIDLSMHLNINQIDCSNNQLSLLNIKNGNNTIMTGVGKGLNATNNPSLTCIQVDNPEYSLANPQWLKDPQTSYSVSCNNTPIADAGMDQTIEEGATVILDASLSSDADGDSIIYKWTAPDGITLSSASAQKPTFIAPDVTQDTQFSFSLIVNDGFEDSPADQVVITVKQVNKVPVANAGADQNVKTGDKVVLNGTGSFDPDQDNLVYFWTSFNGLTLSAASDPSPFFFAPVTKNETDLAFTLTVSDGNAYSNSDTVIISVENKSPVISVKTFFDGTTASAEQVSYELYKETDGKFGKYSATFSIENNTTMYNVEEGNWIILAVPSAPEMDFIPTYYGNSVTWSDAEIITVHGEDKKDLEINCQKTEVETTGEYSIEGFVYQAEGTKSCVILSSVTGNNPAPGTKVLLYQEEKNIPVRTTVTDNEGKYVFNSLIPANYKVIVDIPGFDQVDVWSIKLDSVSVSAINVNFTVITSLGVITDIPETELKTSIYPNPTTGIFHIKTENWPQNSKIEVFSCDSRLVFQTQIANSSSVIDLSDKPDGIYIVNIISTKKKETAKIVLRK